MKMTKHNPSVKLQFSDASGVYIPKRFAIEIKRGAISGVKPEDLDYLALGPGGCLDESQHLAQGESVRGEYYWDIWETVIDQAATKEYQWYAALSILDRLDLALS